jgi:hypothetical protein
VIDLVNEYRKKAAQLLRVAAEVVAPPPAELPELKPDPMEISGLAECLRSGHAVRPLPGVSSPDGSHAVLSFGQYDDHMPYDIEKQQKFVAELSCFFCARCHLLFWKDVT